MKKNEDSRMTNSAVISLELIDKNDKVRTLKKMVSFTDDILLEDIEDSKEYHFYSFDLFFKQTYEEAKLKRDKFNYEDRKKLKDLISNTRHTINNLIIQKDDKKGIEKEKNIFKKVEE